MPSTPPRTPPAAALVHEPYRTERFSDRMRRRARDFLVMGIVGPLTGVLAIAVLHYATVLQRPAGAPTTHVARENVPPLPVPETPMPPQAQAPRTETQAPQTQTQTQTQTPQAPTPQTEAPGPQAPQATTPQAEATQAPPAAPAPAAVADFGRITPTPAARRMADWVVARHDNGAAPFFIIDKRDARLYVFQPDGKLLDTAPVLLGAARGDESWPGIGNVPIKDVKPFQRTTAAGRFVTQPGMDLDRKDVVWIDYDAGLAMHRVINKVRAERRPERLASPSPADNRISFGCINVPIDFFDRYVSPLFGKRSGVAYILPEVKTFHEAFEQNAPQAPVMASLDAKPPARSDLAER